MKIKYSSSFQNKFGYHIYKGKYSGDIWKLLIFKGIIYCVFI